MPTPLKLIFAGTPEFAAVSLESLIHSHHHIVAVYTQPDRGAGRGRKIQFSAVKKKALEHGLAIRQPNSLKNEQNLTELAEFGSDLMVVVAYGLLLPVNVLNIPRFGCINVHASLLPRWRGAAPIQRALLAGDQQTGVTIMQMDEGLDTGDMLLKKSLTIGQQDTSQTLHDRLATLGSEALLTTLNNLPRYQESAQAQDSATACYAAKLSKQEALLDWNLDAELLARQIRAFNPWPVAYTLYNDKNLRVWEAQAASSEATSARPGTVIAQSKHAIEVQTGKGILHITRLQLPGGKPQSASEFINAHNLLNVLLL